MEPFDFAAFHGGIEKWPKLSHEEHAAYWKWKAETAALESLALYPHSLPGLIARDQVWDLVSPYLTKDVLARFLVRAKWTPTASVTIRQALVITLDLFYRYSEAWQPLSSVKLLETLAARWSPRYRMIQSETGCRTIGGMTREDAKCIVRELLCEGLDFWDIWYLAIGGSSIVMRPIPLYTRGWLVPRRGYRITPRRKGISAEFAAIVTADPDYRRPRRPKHVGLVFAGQKIQPASERKSFAARQPYNVVVSGDAAQGRLRQLEGTVLWFDVVNFAFDYVSYRHLLRREHRQELDQDDRRRLGGMRDQVKAARRQIQALDKSTLLEGRYIPIHVGYFRSLNRRYHARHFGPEWVSAKELPHGLGSPRERWFRLPRPYGTTPGRSRDLLGRIIEWNTDKLQTSTPLRGYDTSSSMTQIMCWLCGITELEPLVFNPGLSFTTFLVELFWQHRERLGLRATHTGPDDIREMVKKLWTAHTYGQSLYNAVANDMRWLSARAPERPKVTAGKAQREAYRTELKAFGKAHVGPMAKAIESFLLDQPWYPPIQQYKDAMRCLVATAWAANRFRGVELIDPYDGVTIRWNPVETSEVRVSGDRGDILVYPPGHWGKDPLTIDPRTGKPAKVFKDASPDPDGEDYPVDRGKMMLKLPPFLIHMLDAMLSALVMEQFAPRILKPVTVADQAAQYPRRHVGPGDGWQLMPGRPLPFVALHDAWYLSGHHQAPPVLGEFSVEAPIQLAVRAAAREWDRRLEPVYEFIVKGLTGTAFEGWALKIRDRWRTRSDAPKFVISPAPKPI